MRLRLIRELPKQQLRGKRVLLRVDFEVPVVRGRVENDFRIRAALPTIQYLLASGAKILLLTKRGHFDIDRTPDMSTKVLISHLERLLKTKIMFLKDFLELGKFKKPQSPLYLFENLRFWKEEESNSPAFAKKFAAVADLYVSDNFGTAHRAHASVALLPKLLPSYAGFLLEREIEALERVIRNPARPLAAIIGGIKIETKLPLIHAFLKLRGRVLIGGTLADEKLRADPFVYLPTDGPRLKGVLKDIGPRTIKKYVSELKKAHTIIWNGPLGQIEKNTYAKGTEAIGRAIKNITAFKVVGGGDTVPLLQRKKLVKGFDHISTGGGAMLEFLAGKKLSGIEVLRKK